MSGTSVTYICCASRHSREGRPCRKSRGFPASQGPSYHTFAHHSTRKGCVTPSKREHQRRIRTVRRRHSLQAACWAPSLGCVWPRHRVWCPFFLERAPLKFNCRTLCQQQGSMFVQSLHVGSAGSISSRYNLLRCISFDMSR